jgi:hypothetical protein
MAGNSPRVTQLSYCGIGAETSVQLQIHILHHHDNFFLQIYMKVILQAAWLKQDSTCLASTKSCVQTPDSPKHVYLKVIIYWD